MRSTIELTRLTLASPRLSSAERLLILADLHQQAKEDYARQWLAADPTAVLIAGDWLEGEKRPQGRTQALELLRRLAEHCPVFYSLGNHELGLPGNRLPTGEGEQSTGLALRTARRIKQMTDCGVELLCDRYTHWHSLCIGGLSPACGQTLATAWLADMAREDGFRLLLCHHPEYYEPYVRRYGLDLTVSGHAHGGQWRIFGRGIYAPGQGLLPRYTSGCYDDGHLLVSRGLAERHPVPRIFNAKQAILLELLPQ